MPTKKNEEEAPKKTTRSRAKAEAAEEATEENSGGLLSDPRFVGVLSALVAIAVFVAGFAFGRATDDDDDGVVIPRTGVVLPGGPLDRRVEPPLDTGVIGPDAFPIGNAGYLGIVGSDGDEGAVVAEVVPGSPAEAAGFQAGDVVVAAADQEITSMTTLARVVRSADPGTVMTFTVVRGDQRLQLEAELGATGGRVVVVPGPGRRGGRG